MPTSSRLPRSSILILALSLQLTTAGSAAVLMQETFGTDPNWYSRDGEMAVSVAGGMLQGTFAAQDTPFPEIDAVRIDGSVLGGPWVGDYGNLYPTYTQFNFDFNAQVVLPSSFILQISDGSITFIRNLLPQLTGTGSFLPVIVPLVYDGSWLGGSALDFASVMGNVNFIDLQIGRNTSVEQSYFIDTFALNNDALPGPDPSSIIPEADTLHLWSIATLMFFLIHQRWRRTTG